MAALLLLPVLTLAAIVPGRKILRLLGVTPDRGLEEVVLSVGLGYGALAYVTLGLGLAGALYRAAILGAAVLLVILSWSEITRSRAGPAGEFGRSVPGLSADGASAWRPFVRIVLAVSAAATLLAALAPVWRPDALIYHLGAPKLWLQAHRIYPLPWVWPAFQPMDVEMVYLVAMAVQGDTLASLVNWSLGVWAAGALFVLVRRHFPRLDAWLIAGVFYVSPLVAYESVSSLIDLGWTFFSLAALHCVLRYRALGEERWLLLGGIFGGLAAGSKYPGLLMPALLVLAILFTVPASEGRRRRALLRFAAPIAILVLPWYLRTWVWTGDPIYPFLTAWFGHERLREHLTELAGRYGFGRGPVELLAVPFRLILAGERFDGGELIGPLFLALLPLSAPVLRQDRTAALVGGLAAGYGLLWFYSSPQARFLLPALPLAAILCGAAWRTIAGSAPLRGLAGAATALWMTVATLAAVAFGAAALPVVAGWESRDRYLSRTVWNYRDLQWMNRNLPPDAHVLIAGRNAYYLDRVFVGGAGSMSRTALLAWVDRFGVIYIYCTEADCPEMRARLPEATTVYEGRRQRLPLRPDPARPDVRTAVLRVERR